jgi:ribosomal protein S18 acetylase RimI-like enzyme
MGAMILVFRAAREADKEFARRVYLDTTRPYVAHLPDWNDDYLRARFERRFIVADTRMVERDGVTVGWVRLSQSSEEIVLEQIYIDPACHRQGIGAAIMVQLVRAWDESGKAVRLHVLRNNPARHLYERFGFYVVEENERAYGMWRPPTP